MATTKERPVDGLVQMPPTAIQRAKSALPDYIETGDMSGMEDMGSKDIILPRIGLCQSQTPERKKTDPKYIEGLEEGQFFNTVTKKVYGDVIRVIPVKFWKQRIQFFDIDEGGGIDCQSFNGVDGGHYSPTCATCSHKDFIEGDKPACMEFHNRLSIMIPEGDLAVVSLKSTQIPLSKQWGAFTKMRNAPLYSAIYELKALPMVRNGNNFYGYAQRLVQNVSVDDYKFAKEVFANISGKTLVVDQATAAAEEAQGDPDFDSTL